MIKNERQYTIAKAQAEKFRRALAARHDGPAPREPRAKKWRTDALLTQVKELERDIADYEGLKSGKRPAALSGSDLATLLIQARVARGWTQRELADRLGLKMQAIADYEARDYARASLARIHEVMQALGLVPKFTFALVDDAVDLEEPVKAAAGKQPRR